MESFNPPIYPKSDEDKSQLSSALMNSFLTKTLSDEAKKTIIDAMYEKSFSVGQNIVTQGKTGKEYYILKSGQCQVIVQQQSNVVKSKVIKPGEGFGEIALMYNDKRTATIRTL